VNWKIVFRPICLIREVVYTLDLGWIGHYISGHDFVEIKEDVLVCYVCGYKSIAGK